MTTCEECQPLLAGMLDQELDEGESRRVNEHLVRCAGCRADYDELCRAEDRLSLLRFAEVGDEASALWRAPGARLARIAGLVLVIGGYLALAAYGLYELLRSDQETPLSRIAVAAMVVGGLILFGGVLIERMQNYRRDPYKDIER